MSQMDADEDKQPDNVKTKHWVLFLHGNLFWFHLRTSATSADKGLVFDLWFYKSSFTFFIT